jgi:transposase-like protein
MANSDIQSAAFTNEDKAREALELVRWPNGPVCPHCGNLDQSKIAKSQGKVSRPGLYYCAACNGQFTVTVGTVMERSKIPLTKWLFAMHLMGASKKGMSALQLQRMLGVTYKTAWFLCHRIREAMANPSRGPLGGEGKIVEADETYIGGKERNKHKRKKLKAGRGNVGKMPVVSLVERDGSARSFHMANVNIKTLRPVLLKHVDKKSRLVTDESGVYPPTGAEFAGHGTVSSTPSLALMLPSSVFRLASPIPPSRKRKACRKRT